jgi:hypothetical protein
MLTLSMPALLMIKMFFRDFLNLSQTSLAIISLMSPKSLIIYQRHPLDRSKRDVRILCLQPKTTGNISANLQVVSLASTIRTYACLSYVWGSPTKTAAILIEGEELQVTPNLFSFLHHIQDATKVIVLWVDAICINQDDLEEKSHQVGMMGDIYSGCSYVHIWLGAPPEMNAPETNPFGVIEHFADSKHYHDLPGFSKHGTDDWMFKENVVFKNLWAAFLLVANNTWWTRSWTVQEIILPGSAIVWYGSWSTTWDRIALARMRRNDQLGGCCARSRKAMPTHLRHQLNQFLSEIERIDHFHYLWHHDKATAAEVTSRYAHLRPSPFHETLLSFAWRSCKDSRDRTFSLLGIAPTSMFEGYEPSYQLTEDQCYKKLFRFIIDRDRHGNRVLLGAGFGSNRPGLPSWVRDFSRFSQASVGLELRRLEVYELFNCSQVDSALEVQNEEQLHVAARRADTIIAVGPPMQPIRDFADAFREPLAKWIELCAQALHSDDQVLIRRTVARVICGTLNHDLGAKGNWRRHCDKDTPSPAVWQEFLGGNIFALDDAYLAAVEIATATRCLYITERGTIGLCAPGAQPGDEIVALLGLRVPFALRKSHQTYVEKECYRMIGDCFLLDFMDGEIVHSSEQVRSIVLL